MNIKRLNQSLTYKDSPLYSYFKPFIDASSFDKRYKLFYFYLFRTDVIYNSIKNKESIFYEDNNNSIIGDKINYKNKLVKKFLEDKLHLYIGNVYSKTYGFKPLFLSINKIDFKNMILEINGYTINADVGSDFYYFDKATTKIMKKISENEMKLSLMIFGNLRKSFEKMIQNTKNELQSKEIISIC